MNKVADLLHVTCPLQRAATAGLHKLKLTLTLNTKMDLEKKKKREITHTNTHKMAYSIEQKCTYQKCISTFIHKKHRWHQNDL